MSRYRDRRLTDKAVRAGAHALRSFPGLELEHQERRLASAVIRAALPKIVEHITAQIEAEGRTQVQWLAGTCSDATDMGRLIGTEDAYKDAIRIVKESR